MFHLRKVHLLSNTINSLFVSPFLSFFLLVLLSFLHILSASYLFLLFLILTFFFSLSCSVLYSSFSLSSTLISSLLSFFYSHSSYLSCLLRYPYLSLSQFLPVFPSHLPHHIIHHLQGIQRSQRAQLGPIGCCVYHKLLQQLLMMLVGSVDQPRY